MKICPEDTIENAKDIIGKIVAKVSVKIGIDK